MSEHHHEHHEDAKIEREYREDSGDTDAVIKAILTNN